jgi:transporter family protein
MNWLISCLVAMVCWGLWGFLMKLASEHFNWHQIFVVSSIVTLSASLLIFVLLKPSINVHSPGFGYALLAGVAGALALIAFYNALGVGRAIIVVPLTALYPVITIILSYLILNEKIALVKGVGIMLALVAILLVSID